MKATEFGEITQNKAITPFKVTDFGTNRKLMCDFLLVINTNLPPILHRFQVMAVFSLPTGGRFTSTPSMRMIHCEYSDKLYLSRNYSVSQKNIPDIFSCNSRKHCGIFIIFGTHITEKVGNQQML